MPTFIKKIPVDGMGHTCNTGCSCCAQTGMCSPPCPTRTANFQSCIYLDLSSSCGSLSLSRVLLTRVGGVGGPHYAGCAQLPLRTWDNPRVAGTSCPGHASCPNADICFDFACTADQNYCGISSACFNATTCEPRCFSLAAYTAQSFPPPGGNLPVIKMYSCLDVADPMGTCGCIVDTARFCDHWTGCSCGDGSDTPFTITGTAHWDPYNCSCVNLAGCHTPPCTTCPASCGCAASLMSGCMACGETVNITIYEVYGETIYNFGTPAAALGITP